MLIGKAWMNQHSAVINFQDDSITLNCDCPKSQDQGFIGIKSQDQEIPLVKPKEVGPYQILKRESEPVVSPKRKGKRQRDRELKARQAKAARAPARLETRSLPVAEIALIGAAPFLTLAKQKGSQVFEMSFRDLVAVTGTLETTVDPWHQELCAKAREVVGEVADIDQDVVNQLPEEFKDKARTFSRSLADKLPEHRAGDHHITLEEGRSEGDLGHAPLYRMSEEELKACKEYIDSNLSKGFITASSAPYASPVLFVRKQGGGLRFCVDYRKLNALTKKDKYPLPLIDETLAQLTGCTIMSKIDIRHAFNRIRLATEKDEDLSSFRTRFGSYKYRVMPFGLCNGPSTFQRYINEVLWDDLNKCYSVYMDDILIYSKNRKEHVSQVRAILDKLHKAGL
jgi:Reverse transcriptase (RNA-dependent DNA polymerase)